VRFKAKKEEIADGRGEAWWRAWERYVQYPTAAKRIIETQPQTSTTLVALKCKSCGAPMKSPYRCEYCGTQYQVSGVIPEATNEKTELNRRKLEELKAKIAEVRAKVDEAQRRRLLSS
jgi:hypothetical protein